MQAESSLGNQHACSQLFALALDDRGRPIALSWTLIDVTCAKSDLISHFLSLFICTSPFVLHAACACSPLPLVMGFLFSLACLTSQLLSSNAFFFHWPWSTAVVVVLDTL